MTRGLRSDIDSREEKAAVMPIPQSLWNLLWMSCFIFVVFSSRAKKEGNARQSYDHFANLLQAP
jgi:hypothetical protein